MLEFLWYGGWLIAVAILFAGALRLPEWVWSRRPRALELLCALIMGVAVLGVGYFANDALLRHDRQFDLTAEHVYTPALGAIEIVDALSEPVELVYFYRGDDPRGVSAKRRVEALGRRNPYLHVRTSDPDSDPSLAQTSGLKLYNAALLEARGRRVVVRTTDEKAIATGILRVLRKLVVQMCFTTGHGEYPSDNFEFHTHVEALGGHNDHDHGANAVVETVAHGIGRLRRALEALGHDVVEINPAIDGKVLSSCKVVIVANPREPVGVVEARALRDYLSDGGSLLLMLDVGYTISTDLHRLLVDLGLRLPPEIITDAVQHYAGDAEMVAATSYDPHPITQRLSFTFYPGVRPLEMLEPRSGVQTMPIILTSSSAERSLIEHTHAHDEATHDHNKDDGAASATVIAAASEGQFDPQTRQEFRAVVVGDSDFASNSFYPYMSNSRLALSILQWLAREDGVAVASLREGGIETIELSQTEQRRLFLILVVCLPALIAGIGIVVWIRRR